MSTEAALKRLGVRTGTPELSPWDMDYECPICGNETPEWSKVNAMIWCPRCKLNIPTCLCVTARKPKREAVMLARDIFLFTIEDIEA